MFTLQIDMLDFTKLVSGICRMIWLCCHLALGGKHHRQKVEFITCSWSGLTRSTIRASSGRRLLSCGLCVIRPRRCAYWSIIKLRCREWHWYYVNMRGIFWPLLQRECRVSHSPRCHWMPAYHWWVRLRAVGRRTQQVHRQRGLRQGPWQWWDSAWVHQTL